MARRDKSSIFVDAQRLFAMLYKAQFTMPKRDQAKFGARLQDHCEQIISAFVLAYDAKDCEDDRKRWIERLCSEFAILTVEVRIAQEENMIQSPGLLNSIRETIVRMDESVQKWKNYIYSAHSTRRPSEGGPAEPELQ